MMLKPGLGLERLLSDLGRKHLCRSGWEWGGGGETPGQEQSRSLNSTWAHKTNLSKRGGRKEKAKKEINDLIQPLVSQMKSLLSTEGMTAQGHVCTESQPKTPSSYSSSFLHPTMRTTPCSPDLPGLLHP